MPTSTDTSSSATAPPTDSTTVPPSDGGSTEEDSLEDAEDEFFFYEGTADFTFGPLGKTKKYKDVKRFEVFPDESTGVIAFLGLSVDTERAYFLLSPTVTESDGDGACAPKKPAPCQFLELPLDGERTIKAADAESGEVTTYRLKLTGTELVEVKDPRD